VRNRLKAMLDGARRKRLLAGAALAVALAAVIAVAVSVVPSSTTAASTPRASSGAATVQRRNLVETDTEAGTLSYSNPQTVYNRVSGTITWLPSVGQVIKQGQALYDIDGSPVILMDGTTPAYRDLTSGVTDGQDVLQLNADLVALGFNPDGIVVNDEWQTATTDGVEAFQDSLGDTETGDLTLGQIVFLPGDQLISTVDGTLGSTGGGAGAAATGTPVLSATPQFVSLSLANSSSAAGSDGTTTAAAATAAACPTTTTTTTPTATTPCATTATTPTPTATTPTTTTPPPTTTTTPTTTTPPTTITTPTTTTPTTPIRTTPTTTTPTVTTPGGKGSSVTSEQATLAALIAALLKAEAESKGSSGSSSTGGRSTSSAGSSGASLSGASSTRSSGASSSGSSSGSSGASSAGSAASSGSSTSSSSAGAGATEILQTTSTQLVVTVDLAASSQSEAVVGEKVTVELPNGSVVNGAITAVSPVAQSSSSSSSGAAAAAGSSSSSSSASATVPVTIQLSGHVTGVGLDQAPVSVNFAEAKASNVLSVPVTALLATSGGNYAVQEAAAPHSLIPVTTGLFAAGDVQISGAGIYPGLQVTDSQG
jgi:hypothetical protein